VHERADEEGDENARRNANDMMDKANSGEETGKQFGNDKLPTKRRCNGVKPT